MSMSFGPRLAAFASLLVALAATLSAQAGRQRRLGHEPPLLPQEDVDSFAWSPDGLQLAYWVLEDGGTATLYSRRADATTPAIAYHQRGPVESHGVPRFLAGGSQILFEVKDSAGRSRFRLAPTDGSGPAIDVVGGEVSGGFELTPDEQRFVCSTDVFTDERFVLVSRLLAGGTMTVLNGPLVAGGDVEALRISLDGTRVVYRARETAGNGFYGAPIAQAGASYALSSGLAFEDDFLLGPTHLVFRATPSGSALSLYSSPIDGSSAPVRISHVSNPSFAELQDDYALASGGARVVFRIDRAVDGKLELFSAPVDGSTPPVQLSPAMPDTADVAGWVVSPDGSRVAFRTDALLNGRFDLYVAPANGSAPATLLATPTGVDHDVNLPLTWEPDGAHLLFLLGVTGQATQRLMRVPADGSAAAAEVDDRLRDGELASAVEFSADGARIHYRRFVGDGQELCSVELDGTTPRLVLARGDFLGAHALEPDGTRVAFVVDAAADTVHALHARGLAPADVDLRVSQDFAPVEPTGTVPSFRATPQHVAYIADVEADGVVALYSESLDAPGPRRRLSDTSGGRIDVDGSLAPVLAAGGTRVVYRGWLGEREWLFSSRLDRSADPLVLNLAPQPYASVPDLALSADGSTAVFRSDHANDEVYELFAASTAVQGAPARLNGALVAGGNVQPGYRLSAVGSRVVYLADQDSNETFELYSSTGSGTTTKLSGTLGGGQDVEPGFLLSPDGSRVYFRGDLEAGNKPELFGASTTQSGTRVKLSGTLPSGESVSSVEHVTPDGTRVLYRAFIASRHRLLSVLGDGSQAPVSLSGSLGDYNVHSVLLDASGTQAVFHAEAVFSVHEAIFVVPVAGGVPVQLTHNAPGEGFVYDLSNSTPYQLTPDGTRLLYTFEAFSSASPDLYVVPLDGSSAPRKLDVTGGGPGAVLVDPSSTWVYYGWGEWQRTRLDQVTLPEPVTRALPAGWWGSYDVWLSPDSRTLLYRRGPGLQTLGLYATYIDDAFVEARSGAPTDVVTRTQ